MRITCEKYREMRIRQRRFARTKAGNGKKTVFKSKTVLACEQRGKGTGLFRKKGSLLRIFFGKR